MPPTDFCFQPEGVSHSLETLMGTLCTAGGVPMRPPLINDSQEPVDKSASYPWRRWFWDVFHKLLWRSRWVWVHQPRTIWKHILVLVLPSSFSFALQATPRETHPKDSKSLHLRFCIMGSQPKKNITFIHYYKLFKTILMAV